MKKYLSFFVLAVVALTLVGCGSSSTDKASSTTSTEPVELHIAAAASLTDVMTELADIYAKDNPNVKLTFNFGSSGALQQAIENGGGADLFYSAGKKQMNALADKGLVQAQKDLLINDIVLIVPAKDGLPLESFTDLTKAEVKKIAIGGEGVPVGQYTEEILTNLKLKDEVQAKLILGTDVRQVLAWVSAGEADAGVVYATDAAITGDVKVVTKAPQDSHKPIIYPAAVLKESKNQAAAQAFLDFTSSDTAKAIFTKYGFTVQ